MKRYYEGEVSIFKQSGSPYWTAYYRDSTGRQRKKTLKTKNLKVAKQRARQLNKLLEAGDNGRLEALKRNRSVTVGEVIEQFMGEQDDGPKGPGADWAPPTKASTKPLLDKMNEQWGEHSIAQIRHTDILTFLGTHTSTTQQSSWNRYRATIRGLFKFAVEAEYIPSNPAEKLKYEKVPKRTPKALTDDEYLAVFKRLPDYCQVMFQILVDTGLRRSQLFRLEWRDVISDRRELVIRSSKDSEDRVLPIPPRTAELLDSMRGGSTFKIVRGKIEQEISWPNDSIPTNNIIPFMSVTKSLQKAANAANLGEGRTVTLHMLRHTWATRHRRAGTGLDRLMELGGWDSYEMVLRYADVPPDLPERTDALEQFPLGDSK